MFDSFEELLNHIVLPLNCRVDYIIAPLKVLQSLKETITSPDEKYAYMRRLSPQSAATYEFSKEEVCFSPYLHSCCISSPC